MNGTVSIFFSNGVERHFPNATNISETATSVSFNHAGQRFRFWRGVGGVSGWGIPIKEAAKVPDAD